MCHLMVNRCRANIHATAVARSHGKSRTHTLMKLDAIEALVTVLERQSCSETQVWATGVIGAGTLACICLHACRSCSRSLSLRRSLILFSIASFATFKLARSQSLKMTRFFLFCQLVLATILNITLTLAQNCYMPNGQDRNDRDGGNPVYWSCNMTVPGGSGHSMCCSQTNTCQPNGLCMDNGGNYWRESCTDSTWKDPACLQLYVTDNYGKSTHYMLDSASRDRF